MGVVDESAGDGVVVNIGGSILVDGVVNRGVMMGMRVWPVGLITGGGMLPNWKAFGTCPRGLTLCCPINGIKPCGIGAKDPDDSLETLGTIGNTMHGSLSIVTQENMGFNIGW